MNTTCPSSRTWWPRRRLLVGGTLLVGGGMARSGVVMSFFGRYSATDFFTGRMLQIAEAIEAGDMATVRKLAPGVDLGAPQAKGMTLMLYAMLPGQRSYPNFEAVKTLVSLGVDPDTQMIKGVGSALQSTFITPKKSGDDTQLRFLKAMLDGGLSPNHEGEKYKVLLQRAAGPGGTLAHVKLLVEYGADINERDSIGGTALTEAISTNHADSAIYLVQQGARVDTFKVTGSTPAWAVHLTLERQKPSPMRTQFERLRDLMIERGAKWPPDSPPVVRERMRAMGLEPAVPPGHER